MSTGFSLNPVSVITRRERQVWIGVAQGLTDRQIAESLRTSHKTVNHQRESLKRKIDARNAADVTRLAIKHGLIDADGGVL